ncbi:MAG TPA: dihydrodipicolinate synthase family protein, partial [Arachnia sp.]|nr:dihydrodipicolinate synthase family protein [Arachnia sp.]
LYALNDQAEIDRHLRMVSYAVDIPVFAYDVPVRVHAKLGLGLLINLGRDGVIAGVKDSSGDDVAFRRLVMANTEAGHPLELLTGHEVMVDGMLLLGADGAVPGLANVDPAGYRRLWDAAQAGDWVAARAEQDRLTELFEIAFVPQGRSGDAGGIGAFKAAMALLGIIDSATMPAPLEGLSADDVAAIRGILAKVGLLA